MDLDFPHSSAPTLRYTRVQSDFYTTIAPNSIEPKYHGAVMADNYPMSFG